MKKHVKKDVIPYLTGRLGAEKRTAIEQHLERCAECRNFFDLIYQIENEPRRDIFPELPADPYLPVRVRANFEQQKESIPGKLGHALQLVIYAVAIVISITLGIFLGKQFHQTHGSEEETIITAYTDILNEEPPVVDFVLENGENQNQEENNEN